MSGGGWEEELHGRWTDTRQHLQKDTAQFLLFTWLSATSQASLFPVQDEKNVFRCMLTAYPAPRIECVVGRGCRVLNAVAKDQHLQAPGYRGGELLRPEVFTLPLG